jgi:alcohol dehydrogenase, propanol-preferring
MPNAEATYRAVQALSPGKLELTRLRLVDPKPGYVRIRVEACGVCHSDAGTVEGVFPIVWPRVPGHEAVGVIDMVGAGVERWAVGQRVGVGFLGGSCGHCDRCRGGDLVNCRNQEFTGIQHDGGYAEMLIARASGLISIPDDLAAVDAAPLLCAGLTTFSALRNAPAKAGDLVAVLGIGGLGHLGVQYARHMGFEVVAIARGADKAELARKLGAHHYFDSSSVDPVQALQELGGAALVLATASAGKAGRANCEGPSPGRQGHSAWSNAGSDRSLDGRFAVRQPLDRRRLDRRSRHRRRDAEVQCADRGRGNDRDHAAGESPGGLRQNDVGQGPLSHGPHDAIVITGTSTNQNHRQSGSQA